MKKKIYSNPEVSALEIKVIRVLCTSGYIAQDPIFGDDGDAGGSVGEGDIFDGGSF